MKIREVVLIILGTVATLTFVGFMFDYYLRVEEVQVIRKKVYFDSLTIEEQKHLKKKDSALEQYVKHQDENTKKTLQYHDGQIKKIKEDLEKLKTQE
jgi:hypothetical protein